MKNLRPVRALLLLALPALLVVGLATPADAMPTAPETPSVNAVARVFPLLKNGMSLSVASRVRQVRLNCRVGDPVEGSTERETTYLQRGLRFGRIAQVTAARFASAADVRTYLRRAARARCLGLSGTKGEPGLATTRLHFRLGDHRVGFQAVQTDGKHAVGGYFLFVSRGRTVVSTIVSSTSRQFPPAEKAVRLTRMALRTAH